jgi:hypothetical protein
MVYLDQTEEPYRVMKLEKKIGIHTLMNRLIHASMIEDIKNMFDIVLLVAWPAKETETRYFGIES